MIKMTAANGLLILLFSLTVISGLFAQFAGPYSFVPAQPNLSEGYIRVVDLDNNNYPDILWSGGPSGSNSGWYANSCSGFSPSCYIDNYSGISTSAIAADVNGDGLKDVFVTYWSNNTFYKYDNLGSGSFGSRVTIAGYIYHPYQLYAADIDSDGDTDIVCGGTNAVIWYENDGAGNFIAEHNIGTGSYYDGINSYDFNSDGRFDLVCGNYIYRQEAGGGFTIADTLIGNDLISTHILDLDNDGDVDIIGTENHNAGSIIIYNNDNGNFVTHSAIYSTTGWDFWDSEIADVDNDGDTDLVACAWGGIVYLERTGAYTFVPHQVAAGSFNYMDLKDIDNDGDPDIVYCTDTKSGYFSNMGIVNVYSTTAFTLCGGDSVFTQGAYQHIPGTYYDTLTSASGCDSILAVVLTAEENTINHSICNGDSVFFMGAWHHTQGTYYDSLLSSMGCDSITIHELQVISNTASFLTLMVCDSTEINGQKFYSSGIFTQHLLNNAGCDSLLTIDLTVKYSTQSAMNITACDSVVINNITYDTSGVYIQHLANAVGCDSSLVLNVTINRSTESFLTFSICDSLVLNGVTYHQSGFYVQHTVNVQGCDSTIHISLDLLNDTVVFNEVSCGSYTLNGQTYDHSGTFYQAYPNIHGCDSVLVINLVLADSSYAQNQVVLFDWVKRLLIAFNDITTDINDDLLIIADITGTTDVDPGPGVCTLSNVGSNGDLCVLHFNKNGNFVWAKVIAGTGFANGVSVRSGKDNSVYITGTYTGTVDFDPGPGVFNSTANGTTRDFFVVKLDPNGNFRWAKFVGSPDNDWATSIDLDSDDNVYIAGSYSSQADFDPGPAVFNLTGTNDAFILKLDSAGNFVTAKNFPGTAFAQFNTIRISDDECIYATGYFSLSVDADPGAGVVSFTSNGNEDVLIAKLDPAMKLIWAKTVGGVNGERSGSFDICGHNKISVGGYYLDTVDFDPGSGTFILNNPSNVNGFVLNLDTAGNFLWAGDMEGKQYNNCVSVKNDGFGNTYFTGYFNDTIDMDPTANVLQAVSKGGYDIFITALDNCNNLLFSIPVGGTGTEQPGSLCLGRNGEIYSVGRFDAGVDFDPGPSVYIPSLYGNYIYKLHRCSRTYSSLNIAACNEFTSPSGNYTWNTPGTYLDTIVNSRGCDSVMTIHLTINYPSYSEINVSECDSVLSPDGNEIWTVPGIYVDTVSGINGCDSIVTINLTILNNTGSLTESVCDSIELNGISYYTSGIYTQTLTNGFGCDSVLTIDLQITDIDTTVSLTGDSLYAEALSAQYQWYDCVSGMVIPGATGQFYYPPINGQYSVIISMNNCTDTSGCHTVIITGSRDSGSGAAICYPNPFTGYTKVTFDNPGSRGHNATLSNISGEVIRNYHGIVTDFLIIDGKGLSPGVYFLELTGERNYRYKIVVE